MTSIGRSGSGEPSGCQPSASAVPASRSSIPNASEGARVSAFALAMGWQLFDASDHYEFDGWLTLWPPQSQCFDGQTGWLACEVKSFGLGWHEPIESEEEEIGEYPTLALALAALAERFASFEAYANA